MYNFHRLWHAETADTLHAQSVEAKRLAESILQSFYHSLIFIV